LFYFARFDKLMKNSFFISWSKIHEFSVTDFLSAQHFEAPIALVNLLGCLKALFCSTRK